MLLLLICCGGFAARVAAPADASTICTSSVSETDWCDQARLTGSHLCVSSTGGQEWGPPAVLSMD
jgi:hypothetical protein